MYGRTSGLPQEPEASTLKPLSPTPRSPPRSRREEGEWTCPECSRAFRTKTGLGVHKKRAHPETANAAAAPPQVKRRWLTEEVELLAQTEARLVIAGSSVATINRQLLRELPQLGRSLEGIKGCRRGEAYKCRVQAYLTDMAASPVSQGEALRSVPGTAPCSDTVESLIPERPLARAEQISEERPETVSLPSPDQSNVLDHARIVEDLVEGAKARMARGTTDGKRRGLPRRKGQSLETQSAVRLSARRRRRMEYARVQELDWSEGSDSCVAGRRRAQRSKLPPMATYIIFMYQYLLPRPKIPPAKFQTFGDSRGTWESCRNSL